jgi:Response regulators consisting of a CheY-like receiver domain and a winged-helix DNA-binding domain
MPQILLVDDEERVINFLAVKLKLAGFDVATAGDGVHALALVKATNPDIVLLDLVMPDLNGLDVLKELRVFSKAPVVIMSARQGASEKVKEAGANGFIAKPFDMDKLIDKLKTMIAAPEGPYFNI